MTSNPIGRPRPARPPMKYRLSASAEGGAQAMAVIGWMRPGSRGMVRADLRTLRAGGRRVRDSTRPSPRPAPALRAA
jgi:hypothetical protein